MAPEIRPSITDGKLPPTTENNTWHESGGSDVRMDATHESIIIDILEAVAGVRNIDPMELPPLAEEIDPEALERLVTTARVDVEVSMALYGCRISVDSTGDVSAVRASDAA